MPAQFHDSTLTLELTDSIRIAQLGAGRGWLSGEEESWNS